MKRLLIFLTLTNLLLAACGGSPTPDVEATVQAAIAATQAAQPTETSTPLPTDTPEPTETPIPKPTDTPEPTETPTPKPTDTPAPTATPTSEPTDTPTPTLQPTATPVPTDTPVPVPLLQNGNFDTGAFAPWQIIGSPELTDQVYRSAPYSARLAGRDNADSDYVYQEVTVPANATEVSLDFWYRVSSNDPFTSPADFMCVEIIDSGFNTVLVPVICPELYSVEPKEQWLNFQYVISGAELTPLLGQTVLVSFQGWTNAADPSTAWVDDVSFKVTRAGPQD